MGIRSNTFIPARVKLGFITSSGEHFGATRRRKQKGRKSPKYPFLACGFECYPGEFWGSKCTQQRTRFQTGQISVVYYRGPAVYFNICRGFVTGSQVGIEYDLKYGGRDPVPCNLVHNKLLA